MARAAAWPTLTAESSISHYLEEIRRFPILDGQEEYVLAKRWREDGDRDAAHQLGRPSDACCSAYRSSRTTLVSSASIFSRRASAARTDIANEFTTVEGRLIDLRRQ